MDSKDGKQSEEPPKDNGDIDWSIFGLLVGLAPAVFILTSLDDVKGAPSMGVMVLVTVTCAGVAGALFAKAAGRRESHAAAASRGLLAALGFIVLNVVIVFIGCTYHLTHKL